MLNKVAVVILNWNGKSFLEIFLPTVIKHSGDALIVVADNQSSDDSVLFLRNNFPDVTVIVNPGNDGFSGSAIPDSEFAIDGLARNPEPPRCLVAVAAGLFQNGKDMPALDLLQRSACRFHRPGRAATDIIREAPEDQRALDEIAKFPHISGPGIARKGCPHRPDIFHSPLDNIFLTPPTARQTEFSCFPCRP